MVRMPGLVPGETVPAFVTTPLTVPDPDREPGCRSTADADRVPFTIVLPPDWVYRLAGNGTVNVLAAPTVSVPAFVKVPAVVKLPPFRTAKVPAPALVVRPERAGIWEPA